MSHLFAFIFLSLCAAFRVTLRSVFYRFSCIFQVGYYFVAVPAGNIRRHVSDCKAIDVGRFPSSSEKKKKKKT